MFTFANPWLFWMLPALALPWIFRRRQEERIRHINFPLLQFLRESEEKDLINPQLQEFLLLLLRTLLLALLILSLAGPKWTTPHSAPNGFLSYLPFGHSFQNHLVVMDTSYSMGYGQGESSWWRETERAWEAVNRQFSVFSTQLVRWDRSTIRPNRINRLNPLSAVERDTLFASSPREEGTSVLELFEAIEQSSDETKNVVLITDGQRYPWKDLLEVSFNQKAIPSMLVVTTGSEPVMNVWCEIHTLSSPPWGIAGWETIAGNVKAILQEEFPGGTISILRSDSNETLYSQSVSLPLSPGQVVQMPFEFSTQFSDLRTARQGSDSGIQLDLTLRVEPQDLLPFDNEIQIHLPAISSFTVGLVESQDDIGPISPVLTSAINPLRGTSESPPVVLERLSPPNLAYPDSADYVILSGDLMASWLSPVEVPVTLDYIKNGGSVLLFTGDEVSAEGPWSQLLREIGWRWLDPESTQGQPETVTVGGNGLYAKALSSWEEDMWTPWIPERHGRVEGEAVSPLISYRIGEQTAYLITQFSLGKGRVWLVNTSLNPNANTLLSPILPALLWETGKVVAREKHGGDLLIPTIKAESDLTLLTTEEKQTLTDRYGIRFTTLATLDNAIEDVYGGTDLRLVLLFLCLVLALGESWLSNHLASL